MLGECLDGVGESGYKCGGTQNVRTCTCESYERFHVTMRCAHYGVYTCMCMLRSIVCEFAASAIQHVVNWTGRNHRHANAKHFPRIYVKCVYSKYSPLYGVVSDRFVAYHDNTHYINMHCSTYVKRLNSGADFRKTYYSQNDSTRKWANHQVTRVRHLAKSSRTDGRAQFSFFFVNGFCELRRCWRVWWRLCQNILFIVCADFIVSLRVY